MTWLRRWKCISPAAERLFTLFFARVRRSHRYSMINPLGPHLPRRVPHLADCGSKNLKWPPQNALALAAPISETPIAAAAATHAQRVTLLPLLLSQPRRKWKSPTQLSC